VTPALWIMLAGTLAAGSCALVGCFLVLRRMAMLGDAISHAVLPGIVIAFLLSNSRAPLPMLIGASALGLVTAGITEWLHRTGRLQQDASIGVTFTWLFAIGVILVSALTGQVDLDQECVLYGEIAYVPWDVWVLPSGASLGPRAIWIMGAALLINATWIVTSYKELKICAFDPGLAASLGIPVAAFHYALMAATSITVVTAFESVGAILVVGLLVGPAATAYLLTDRLSRMLMIAIGIGTLSSVLGYYLARALDCSIAGAMTVVIGTMFALAFLFSPGHGILRRRHELESLEVEARRLIEGARAARHGEVPGGQARREIPIA
jgi:manganese/zinc/iron transport system permease protein